MDPRKFESRSTPVHQREWIKLILLIRTQFNSLTPTVAILVQLLSIMLSPERQSARMSKKLQITA